MACLTSSGASWLTQRHDIGSVKPEIQDFNYCTTESTAPQSQRQLVKVVQRNSFCFYDNQMETQKYSLGTKYSDFRFL
jgi:hypothetical protein